MLFAIFACCCTLLSPKPQPAIDLPLLISLGKQNSAARQALETIPHQVSYDVSMVLEGEFIPPGVKQIKSEKHYTLLRINNNVLITCETQNQLFPTNEIQTDICRAMVCDDYCAISYNPGSYAQYYYDSQESMSDYVKGKIEVASRINVWDYGFGVGDPGSLESYILHNPKYNLWTIDKNTSGNGTVYIAKVYREAVFGLDSPEDVLRIDADHGFLVTEVIAYKDKPGQVWIKRSIELQEVKDGLWFPKRVTEERPGLNMLIHNISFEEKDPSTTQISFETLGPFEDGQSLARISVNGEKSFFIYENGRWMPQVQR